MTTFRLHCWGARKMPATSTQAMDCLMLCASAVSHSSMPGGCRCGWEAGNHVGTQWALPMLVTVCRESAMGHGWRGDACMVTLVEHGSWRR